VSTGRICVRSVHFAEPGETAREAARRMASLEVGTLLILNYERKPIGLVTDRDLMIHCLAEGRDPDETTVEKLMTAPLVTVREETPIEEALSIMARDGVRRVVVVDEKDQLVGILALDDVLDLLAEEMETIGRLLRR